MGDSIYNYPFYLWMKKHRSSATYNSAIFIYCSFIHIFSDDRPPTLNTPLSMPCTCSVLVSYK